MGTELRFWRDRIGVDFTYFHNTNKNGIVPLDVSPASGVTNIVVNSGQTTVKGIELALSITPVKTNNFSYTAMQETLPFLL